MKLNLLAIMIPMVIIGAVAVRADERLIAIKSPHSVASTIDRLSAALKRREIPIVARVDHASAAERIGEILEPTEVLIFGNPKLGTPLMQSNRLIGLDLPMRVLAWQDDAGQTWLAYEKPESLKTTYGIRDRNIAFATMGQALEKLVGEAVKPD